MISLSNANTLVGQPVRSIQNRLRRIANTYDDIPMIVPDGRYGPQTEEAVMAFQLKFMLPITGEVDYDTWNKIVEVYEEIIEEEDEPAYIKIYPDARRRFAPGESSIHLYPIQAIIKALSYVFEELGEIAVDGTHNDGLVDAVKHLQVVFGMEPTGVIDKKFWNKTAKLYEAHVSRNRFRHIK